MPEGKLGDSKQALIFSVSTVHLQFEDDLTDLPFRVAVSIMEKIYMEHSFFLSYPNCSPHSL